MRTLFSNRWLSVALFTVVIAASASAQVPAIDYLGFGWEDGGLPPSNPGDLFTFVGVADSADPMFGVDLGATELTFYGYDLISTGEIPIGGGMYMVNYVGGMLDIYVDGGMDADWGITPPNATAPSTFGNGTLFFRGEFNDFTVFFTAAGSGSYEGNLNGIEGELIGGVCTGCAYTWGGIFTTGTGAQIPDGYDFQMDGVFEVDPAIADETATWSDVKTLYR